MIIRFSHNKSNNGFIVADKVMSNFESMCSSIRRGDTIVFSDMEKYFCKIKDVVRFIEAMMMKSVYVIFENDELYFSPSEKEAKESLDAMKACSSFSVWKGIKKKYSFKPSSMLDTIRSFCKKNEERFMWANSNDSISHIGYRRVVDGFIEFYMRNPQFIEHFVEPHNIDKRSLFKELKKSNTLIYTKDRCDSQRAFDNNPGDHFFGVRFPLSEFVESSDEIPSESIGCHYDNGIVYKKYARRTNKPIEKEVKTVSTVKRDVLYDNIKIESKEFLNKDTPTWKKEDVIEYAFAGYSVREVANIFNIECSVVWDVLYKN